jgi:long-chain acyl-CoA synthetase
MSVRCCRRAHFSTVRGVTTSVDSATWWSDDWASRVIDVGVAVTNLSVYLAASAKNSPDARAVVSDDTTTTYWKLGNDVARFADYLTDAGLRPGDRVGVMLPNGLDFATIFYGVLHAGGVVVPLNPRLHARAVDFLLTITDTRLLFVTSQHAIANTVAAVTAGVQPVQMGSHGIARMTAGFTGHTDPVVRTARDAAVVLPIVEATGAHTVQLTHGELANCQAVTAGQLTLGRGDLVMGCLPMIERVGMTYSLLAALSSASTLVLPSFDPAFDPASALELIAEECITVFEGAPPMYLALLDAARRSDEDFSSLRVGVMADGTLPVDVLRRFEDRFGCVVVHADEFSAASPPTIRGSTDLM